MDDLTVTDGENSERQFQKKSKSENPNGDDSNSDITHPNQKSELLETEHDNRESHSESINLVASDILKNCNVGDTEENVAFRKLKDMMAEVIGVALKPLTDKLDKALFKVAVIQEDIKDIQDDITTMRNQRDGMVLHTIEQEVYNRKKNLIVTGLSGQANEPVSSTIVNVRTLFEKTLKLKMHDFQFSAVHRLNQKKDAAIIVSMTRLADTNSIMENAYLLKGHNEKNQTKVSIQVQTHPAIKVIRHELLEKRKTLPKGYHVKSLPKFPFFGLTAKNKEPIYSSKTKADVVDLFLKYIDENN